MAGFTVFVSSTFYDLKYLRGALAAFFSSLGHDSIMFERGDVTHIGDRLDRESVASVATADAMVCILGGRYGTAVPDDDVSMTEAEVQAALAQRKLVWVFVERNVHAEFETYRRNVENSRIDFAHVQDVRVFRLLERIRRLPLTSPVIPFDAAADITEYLRRQFSLILHEYVDGRRVSGSAGPHRVVFSSAVDAARAVEERLVECLQRDDTVYVRWIGMSMFNAWSTLVTILERTLPEAATAHVHVQVAMLDDKWKAFPAINETWARQAGAVRQQILDFRKKPYMRKKGYTVEVGLYAHMPCIHGLLLNERYVFLGNCSWEHGTMFAGTKWYEFFSGDDPYGRSRISLFKGWFDYCFDGPGSVAGKRARGAPSPRTPRRKAGPPPRRRGSAASGRARKSRGGEQ
jgi:hypothetical protein